MATLQELLHLEEVMRAKLLIAEKAVQLYHQAVAANEALIEYIFIN